jgi:hypothetical protein
LNEYEKKESLMKERVNSDVIEESYYEIGIQWLKIQSRPIGIACIRPVPLTDQILGYSRDDSLAVVKLPKSSEVDGAKKKPNLKKLKPLDFMNGEFLQFWKRSYDGFFDEMDPKCRSTGRGMESWNGAILPKVNRSNKRVA